MKDLLWAIPLFPLTGFLVNGLLYLLEHRTKVEPSPRGPHGEQTGAEAQRSQGHQRAELHAGTHPRFQTLHTAVGTGMVALSCLFAFGAIFDVGLRRLSEGASPRGPLLRGIPARVQL